MSWSRNARLFAFEEDEGGCLPIVPIVDAIMNGLNFKGYVSVEIFSPYLFEEDREVPSTFASRGMKSWNTMMKTISR
jgi:4-hydroxyphenylpyruvate dioxygenase